MPLLSIRNTIISLVLFCITVTAFFSTFFSILSGQKALDETTTARDASLARCFETGEDSVLSRTNDFLNQINSGIVTGIKARLFSMQLLTEKYISQMQTYDAATTETWDYLFEKRSDLWHLMHTQRKAGVTGCGYITRKQMMLQVYENPNNIRNTNGFHPIYYSFNNGTDYESHGPTAQRTYITTAKPLTAEQTGPYRENVCADADYPKQESDPPLSTCHVPHYTPHGATFWPLSFFIQPGSENIRWSQLISVGPFIAVTLIGTSVTPGTTGIYSLFFLGMDLGQMSKYLSGIDLGSEKARAYTNVASNWMEQLTKESQQYALTGVSRGIAVNNSNPEQRTIITPDESADPIISGTGAYIRDLNGSYEGLVNASTAHEFEMNGESFFVKVTRLQDLAHGINWYCTVVIDRAYILGSIDAQIVALRDSLHRSSDDVDDDLRRDRAALIASIAAAGVVMLTLCVVLVMKIIEPLVILQQEMALVAMMRLEGVHTEKPRSRLAEVKCMQESFFTMHRNLKEYRNYMPASILEPASDGDGTEVSDTLEESLTAIGSPTTSYGESTTTVQTTKSIGVGVFTNELRARKVSLLAVGCKSLHSETNMTVLLTTHRNYLASILQVCKELKGIPDSFQGDMVYVSWNAVRVTSNQASSVGKCCQLLEAKVEGELAIGGVNGTVRCGNMGCEGMKKFSFMGGLFGLLNVTQKLNSEFDTTNLITDSVMELSKVGFYTKPVTKILYTPYSKEPVCLHTVMGVRDVTAGEWMYELQEAESSTPYAAYNLSVRCFFESNYQSAAEAIGRQSVMDPHIKKYKEVLFRRLSDKIPFAPLTAIPMSCAG